MTVDELAGIAGVQAGVDITGGAAVQVGRMPAGAMRPELAGSREGRQARLDMADRWISGRPVTAVVSGAGVATMLLDGPSLGYQWTIRLVVISAVDAMTTAVQGVGWVYAGTTGSVLVPGNVRWGMPNLPNIANFGSDELVVQYGEQLPCQVTGGTPGQVVQASYAYQLYRPGGRYTGQY